jgi:hypothetical protein
LIERQKAEQMIQLKLDTFQNIRQGKLRVNLPNPIIDLAKRVAEGKFTLEHAQEVARQPSVFVELMFPAVTTVCDAVETIMIKDWRPAVTIMKVLISALDGRRDLIPENQQAMEISAMETWLAVVCRSCADVPDGRLFRDAVVRGDAVADVDTESDPPAPILQRLGVLHLDPYVAGRANIDLDRQLRDWQMRLSEEYGLQLAGVPATELQMPSIDEALPRAVLYFRRAAARRTGEARGRTLKALVEALRWHEFRKLPFDAEECVSLAREALELLPLQRFPAEHAELGQIIIRFETGHGKTVDKTIAAAQKVLGTPVESWVAQKGVLPTIDIFRMNAEAVAETDPSLALRLMMSIDQLVRSQPEAARMVYDNSLLRLLVRMARDDLPRAEGEPLQLKLQTLVKSADAGCWPVARLAYSVIALAASATATKQEGEALDVLRSCARTFDLAGQDVVVQRCLPYLRAVLSTGHAVNAFDAGRCGEAASLYVDALSANLDQAGQPLAALDIVRRLLDLAQPGKPEQAAALEALVAGLTGNALALELQAGEAATNLIQSACRYAMSVLMASGSAKATVILFVLDVAKGRRFRAAVAEPDAALGWLSAPRTVAIERDIGGLRDQAVHDAIRAPSAIDENTLVASYVSPSEMLGGVNATEQLRNLQIQFDNGLSHQLSSGQNDHWVPTIEKIQSLLDATTVLLIQFIGHDPENTLTITTLLISDNDVAAGQGIFPGLPTGIVQMSARGLSVIGNLLSISVGQLRDLVTSPPGPRSADSRALASLESDHNVYLGGPLKDKLTDLRAAGKNHLCVVPHGPLHYYPFHLLGPEDHPLADEWCVTYLPHPRLIDRARISSDGKAELSSIGVNFGAANEFYLGPLTECEDEARAVAAVYGHEAILLLGNVATKKAVIGALVNSRRIHISTHGRHNVSAPSFQCIYLQAGPHNERIIYAYELLRLDLRGLDLVTLSACETALGRIDVADNPRGIPAALQIAGVSTIVAALWNVEDTTATYFFTAFYRALKATDSKKLAFYEAQLQTRREFPKYRDWGAFQLIGSWS